MERTPPSVSPSAELGLQPNAQPLEVFDNVVPVIPQEPQPTSSQAPPTNRVDLRRRPSSRASGIGADADALAKELIAEFVARRHARGLTQAEVADLVGTTQPTVARMEGDKHSPKLSTIAALALAVGLRLVLRDDPCQAASPLEEQQASPKQTPTEANQPGDDFA